MGRPEHSPPFWPRGLSRAEAADYVGICATTFDKMVRDGRMPRAKRIDGRKVWDRLELDAAFARLPTDGGGKAPAPGADADVWEDVAA